MIPTDAASRLRLITNDQPAPTQPIPSTRQLTDVLSDLVPGQRIMAQIQALLPNSTYRAVIAQREIVLALPFLAKPGDALELEVVENDGKLALAFAAAPSTGKHAAGAGESVTSTLSQTGKLIGDLLAEAGGQWKKGSPTPLNANQPLVQAMPAEPAQLAPVLKEALMRSGMFYEAHQARWVEGRLPTESLLQEPQGKFSGTAPGQPAPALPAPGVQGEGEDAMSAPPAQPPPDSPPTQKPAPSAVVQPDLMPIVRQQLDALANQSYVWQGQIWPGQQMEWTIEEEGQQPRNKTDDADRQWHTRLTLTLPGLGSVDALMRLRLGGSIDVALVTDNDESRSRLIAAGDALRRQLDDADLTLTGFSVQHAESPG